MHQLILLRHAETIVNPVNDFNRALTSQGQKQADAIAEFFTAQPEYLPDLILCSSATRTKQTASPTVDRFKIKIAYLPELYNSSPEKMAEIVADHFHIKNLMIISHNPTISLFADSLYQACNISAPEEQEKHRGNASILPSIRLEPSQMAIFQANSLNDLDNNINLKFFYESI